ncbi:MAG TPA: hypothetical protein VK178_00485 [Opitutaceae bacterium]|nr:hypothetical protein [Opitutaceae bacterium]
MIYLVIAFVLSILLVWALTAMEASELDHAFKKRYPESAEKIAPLPIRKHRGYFFLGDESKRFLEQKNDNELITKRKHVVALFATASLLPFGGFTLLAIVSLLVR